MVWKPKWIRSRDVNGNYGYINTSTGEFRSTIPNSILEKLVLQRKRNKVVSNEQSRREVTSSWQKNRRNHSDETIKKIIQLPVMTVDKNGDYLLQTLKYIAPSEDSANGVDPVGRLVVETAVLNKPLQLAGKGLLYGLGRTGDDWARAKLINREMLNIGTPTSTTLTPVTRLRYGDIEVNDPNLYYRQGSLEIIDDFLNRGLVSGGGYANPMFAKGKLWYGVPTEDMLKPRSVSITSSSGRTLSLTKHNESVPKTHLLVSDPETEMVAANLRGSIRPISITTSRTTPITDRLTDTLFKDMPDFVKQYNEAYYSGELEDKLATNVVGDPVRRVPSFEGAANTSNTTAYRWIPGFGYLKIGNPPSIASWKPYMGASR